MEVGLEDWRRFGGFSLGLEVGRFGFENQWFEGLERAFRVSGVKLSGLTFNLKP